MSINPAEFSDLRSMYIYLRVYFFKCIGAEIHAYACQHVCVQHAYVCMFVRIFIWYSTLARTLHVI